MCTKVLKMAFCIRTYVVDESVKLVGMDIVQVDIVLV